MWLKLVAALGVALTCPFACADNGQTGSIGYACVEEECDQQSRALITWIADVSSPRFVASRCRAGNTGPADRESLAVQHCQCFEADGGLAPRGNG